MVARMAELVDALDSKSSSREGVRVRPPLRVPLFFLFSQCNENYTGIHPQRARVRHARLTGHT